MILNYDPFGLDRMVYTIKRKCVEEPNMPYDDGATTIYLYTRGTQNVPSQALKDMLQFLENSTKNNVTNENLENIHRLMDEIKRDRKVGINYMHTWERERMIKAEGREEGRVEGLAEGLAEGRAEGLSRGAFGIIEICRELGVSKEETIEKLQKNLDITYETALQYLQESMREA